MDCPSCQRTNPSENTFCGGCGAQLPRVCPSCGRANKPDNNFCGGCGASLGESGRVPLSGEKPGENLGQSQTTGQSRFSPRDYTPKHLAEKILTSKSALEGERKQVTVLFADVKGSMDLAEQVDPEEWHRILNRFFEILSDGVHRFEGTVNQYTGDGIMALFGAPITHEDHAHRACYAALHLQDELRSYAEELKRTKGLNFAVRMGLNSGEVIVGKIGDDLRMDYTAQGHTVGLAARLEQLAESGKAYVSENTAGLVSGFFELRDLGEFELKGASKRINVFELEGLGTMRTRFDVSKARGLTRFVGRADEMETLDRALAHVLEGNAQVVGVVADAGTGKSRLCYEFIEKCKVKGIRVREVHCVAHGKSIPLLPVFEFLRGYFGVTERDSDEEARRKIAGTLTLIDRELTDSIPILFDFLGIPDPKHPAPALNPEAKQRQLFTLTKRIVQARNREEPGVILIEDLHWIDGGSEAFVANLAEALPGTRTLLLLNFRPEYRATWIQSSYYQQLSMLPLGVKEISELLAHLLGKDPSLGDLAKRVQAQTAGNPFFIEEAVQSLVESGALQGVRGAYKLTRPVDEISIPASVQTVLAARIDRLPEREKQVLHTAAVIGKEFPEPVLKEVANLADTELGDSLRALSTAEFIYESSLYPVLEYAFKHPLTQEVAYRSQLADRRERIHEGVAKTISELYPDKLDEQSALLAHHWENAGDAWEAAQWHTRAAEWAGVRDPGEAQRHWQSIRDLLEGVPESPETLGLGLFCRINLLNLGWRLGLGVSKAQELFVEGKALTEKSGNHHALAGLHFLLSASFNLAGELQDAEAHVREAIQLAEKAGDPGLRLGGDVNLAFVMISLGRLDEAEKLLDGVFENPPENLKLGGETTGFSPYIQAIFYKSILLSNLGRLDEMRDCVDEAIRLARENDELEILTWAPNAYIYYGEYTGNSVDAIDVGRRMVEVAEKTGSNFSRVISLFSLGHAHYLNGDWAEARDLLEAVLARARESNVGLIVEGRTLSYLAEAYLGLGEHDRALAAAREGLEICEGHGMRGYVIRSLLAMVRVLLGARGKDAAPEIGKYLDEGIRVGQETGGVVLLPQFHELRAEILGLTGDEAGATRARRDALRLYRGMNASGHVARLEKELNA